MSIIQTSTFGENGNYPTAEKIMTIGAMPRFYDIFSDHLTYIPDIYHHVQWDPHAVGLLLVVTILIFLLQFI